MINKKKVLDKIKSALGIPLPQEEECKFIFDHEPVWDGQTYSCWKCGLEFESTGKYLFKGETKQPKGFKEQVQTMIAEEIIIAQKEGQPTSCLTSLAVRIGEL